MTDRTEETHLTIGQFGQISQLSRKALRLYDERNLLTPVAVDADSGYRYYTKAQVVTARRIRLLRLMEMPLEKIAAVLTAWETDAGAAQHLINRHVSVMAKQMTAVHLAARLLHEEVLNEKERNMSFTIIEKEMPEQTVVSIRRHITVPAYHQWISTALRQLWSHIETSGAQPAGDPLALYYGHVNEEDDGPVEICIPFHGTAMPQGEIKVRQIPAHLAIQLRTYDEYNRYPKLLEMWNALGRYVQEHHLEPNWDGDMATYELWHDDDTMTLGYPVSAFTAE